MKTNKDTQKTRRVVPIIDAECPICFENLRSSKDIVTTNCNHIFHKDCLDSWLIYSNTCPCCRFQLRVQQLKPLIPDRTKLSWQSFTKSFIFYLLLNYSVRPDSDISRKIKDFPNCQPRDRLPVSSFERKRLLLNYSVWPDSDISRFPNFWWGFFSRTPFYKILKAPTISLSFLKWHFLHL